MGMPMNSSTRSPVWLRMAYCRVRGLDDARAVELAAGQHHLVERGHGARRAVARAARRAALAPFGRVRVGVAAHAFAARRRLMHVGGARELRLGQADIELAAEAQRLGHGLADDVAEVLAGDGLDQHAERPVGAQPVVVDLRARRPFEREVADDLAQPLVVGPRILGNDGVGKACLVRDGLQHRDVALGVLGERRHVIGDLVGEGEQPALGQRPQRDGGHHLGVGIEQPQRVVGRRARFRIGDRVAEASVERELAVAGERDLAAGIAVFRDMPLDQGDQPVDLAFAKAQRFEIGRGQGKTCCRANVGDGVHDRFPPVSTILSFNGTSMNRLSTCCVLGKNCHNARHVRPGSRRTRLPQ